MCQPQPFPYTPQNSARASGGHSAGCSGDCSFSAKIEKVCLSHSPLPVRWSSSHFLHVCHDRNLNVRGTFSHIALALVVCVLNPAASLQAPQNCTMELSKLLARSRK